MRILLDTNVLLRIAQTVSPHHAMAMSAVISLSEAECELCLVPQVLYEFWVAATRPLAVNGLEMTAIDAARSIEELVQSHSLLRDERGIFAYWQTLVADYAVLGKTAHDARLVAAMQRHGLACLLTFNKSDFARFPTMQAITPQEVLSGAFRP